MTKLCYILLCHKNPDAVTAQVKMLTAHGDSVVVHVDKSAAASVGVPLKAAFGKDASVAFAKSESCGWGEWSLVQASLNGLRKALATYPDATHYYLISGDCWPIKSAETIRDYLTHLDKDIIESADFFESDFIKTGLKKDRLIYRHFFNEREDKKLFYAMYEAQKFLRLERELPKGLKMRIGSQWWCLRRKTAEAVAAFTRERRDIMRFFKTTWIPDETFFQTLVHHLVPEVEIVARPPTFLAFSDYGMPVNFQNDHYDFLLAQEELFARKLSVNAEELKARLVELFSGPATAIPEGANGREFFHYLRLRGRTGNRFTRRIWEREGEIGRENTVVVIACKKWHIAKAYAEALQSAGGISAFGYVFNEDDAGLPFLGGTGSTLQKRSRHRRAFLRLLFRASDQNRIAFCIDPVSIDTLQDLAADSCDVRLLEIGCDFDDDYLIGHAQRMGIATDTLNAEMRTGLLRTLRANIRDESDQLHALDVQIFERLHEDSAVDDIAAAIRRLTYLDHDRSQQVATRARFD